jgi:5-methylcytosine-specific restriction protein A
MYPFFVDHEYTRRDIYKIIGISENTRGENWHTGYKFYNNDFFIFSNVGMPGRTGHDHNNEFFGNLFFWSAKSKTRLSQPEIQRLLNPSGYVYIFYRRNNLKPFIFAGTGIPFSHEDTSPVKITWKIINGLYDEHLSKKETDLLIDSLKEGGKHEHIINIYERSPEARKRCIESYGYKCCVCGFDFEKEYGELGKGFIHVHHIKPLSEINENYNVDPKKDLRPICPNCHAMLHRKSPILGIDELKIIKQGHGI